MSLPCSLPHFQRTDFLAFSSALVAASSFLLSYLTFQRDRGRLDVKVGIWREVTRTGETGARFILISAVNSGRRPISVDSVGGFPRWQRSKRILFRFFPKHFAPVGFLLLDPITRQALIDSATGKYRVLSEGESFQIKLPLSDDIPTITDWTKIHHFYVGDTTGREHYARQRVVRKFVEAMKKHARTQSKSAE